MQEFKLGTNTCLDEEDKLHTFHYTLLVQPVRIGTFEVEAYGVKVEESGGECAVLNSVSYSRTKIDALLRLLTEHAVTPVNLSEVVEDWQEKKRLPQTCGRR